MLFQLLTVFLAIVAVINGQCPTGCECIESQSLMRCNDIDTIPTGFDSSMYTVFIFDDCNFQTLANMPSDYTHTHQLHIVNSNVDAIGIHAFKDLSELTVLKLSGNKLEYLNATSLYGLEKLNTIDLSSNRLTALEKELFQFNPLLEKVLLNDNPIKTIDTRTFAQPKDPENDINKMSKIKYIEMENTGLTTFPGAVFCMHSKLPHLVTLDLSRNNFSTLDEFLFKHTDGLEGLELDSCELAEIKRETFGSMKKLKSLRLSFNKITSIDEQAFDDFYATLEYLHLENNLLTELPYGLINWDVLQVLNASYNPWDCSCNNGWMQQYKTSPNDTNYILKCASPEEHKGKNALQVVQYDIGKCSAPNTGPDPMIAVYVAIPIIVILSVITIIIIVKICRLKRNEAKSRSAKYSLVYKPTTENA